MSRPPIAAHGLAKRFGDDLAVDDLSFEVARGEIAGLLGHADAGKTTVLRMLVGHVHHDAGKATILGKPYAQLEQPLHRVGVLLGTGAHPARNARDHLRVAAARAGLPLSRVGEALALVGLEREATIRTRLLAPGARRRLALAATLLARPDVLILDDPAEGLDAEGVRWLHSLLRALAGDGCAVLLAARRLADAAQVADRVLVLDRGALIAESSPAELLREAGSEVVVRSPGANLLADELRGVGIATSAPAGEELRVQDVPPRVVSELAVATGVPVWEVRAEHSTADDALEELIARGGGSANGAEPERHDGDVPGDPDVGDARGDSSPGEDGRASDDDTAASSADGLAELESSLDEQLAAHAPGDEPRVVAVVAPAAGLGRTTLAFVLADALAAGTGARTLAVALSCDHERMSLPVPRDQRTRLGLDDLLGDLPGFDDRARISPYVAEAASGAHVLCGPRRAEQLAAITPPQLATLLDFASGFYDVVVLDVGDLAKESLRAVVSRADEVLLLGAPDVVKGIDAGDPVLDAIEAERSERAMLVFNQVDEERMPDTDGSPAYALVPRDRELIRALDQGNFSLDRLRAPTRVALKRMALLVAERLS